MHAHARMRVVLARGRPPNATGWLPYSADCHVLCAAAAALVMFMMTEIAVEQQHALWHCAYVANHCRLELHAAVGVWERHNG